MPSSTVGERIKELRLKHKLTQKEFGNIINVSYGHISNIEKGKDIPSERLLDLIILKFPVSEKWLKYGRGTMNGLPLYTKFDLLTVEDKDILQKLFRVNNITDKHFHLCKIAINMLNKDNIQENSDTYFYEYLEKLLMCIDSYLKLASECEDTLEQNTFKSFKTAMENEIIKNLHFTANAFFTDNLNDSDDE
jgi:transcriptional regulator with XRE-family HTH domain